MKTAYLLNKVRLGLRLRLRLRLGVLKAGERTVCLALRCAICARHLTVYSMSVTRALLCYVSGARAYDRVRGWGVRSASLKCMM